MVRKKLNSALIRARIYLVSNFKQELNLWWQRQSIDKTNESSEGKCKLFILESSH